MLTRIEIDGFKTFRDFDLDVPPFLAVLGRNASGKSNLFDAVTLLASTADRTLMEAAARCRGEPHELIHSAAARSETRVMNFAVEVLLDSEVDDDFGDTATVRHSRLRYELALALRPAQRRNGGSDDAPDRLFVERESVRLIRQGVDRWLTRNVASARARKNVARYSSRSTEMLLETTVDESGRRIFVIHQDGRAGRTRRLPAAEAASTVLSTLTTANDYPHLFALKRELESWGMLHLDPGALRGVSSFDDSEYLSSNGANLANALHRIRLQTADEARPDGILPEIANDLAAVIPEVQDVEVVDDRARRQRQVSVRTRDDAPYSAGVASDGTLRALALLVELYDPERRGVICFEEPENGIYPRRLVDFVAHLRDLVHDSFRRRAEDPAAPLIQLMLSSHSPVILRALPDEFSEGAGAGRSGSALRDDVAYFDSGTLVSGGVRSRVSRVRKVRRSSQTAVLSKEDLLGSVAPAEIDSIEVWKSLEPA